MNKKHYITEKEYEKTACGLSIYKIELLTNAEDRTTCKNCIKAIKRR